MLYKSWKGTREGKPFCISSITLVIPEYSSCERIEPPSNSWFTIFWFGLIHRMKFVPCKMYNCVAITHNNKFIYGSKITEPLFGKENIPFKGRGHVLLQTSLFNSNQFSSQCQNTVGLIQASQNKLLTANLLFWEIWSQDLASMTLNLWVQLQVRNFWATAWLLALQNWIYIPTSVIEQVYKKCDKINYFYNWLHKFLYCDILRHFCPLLYSIWFWKQM
jgi:hypothetical protein